MNRAPLVIGRRGDTLDSNDPSDNLRLGGRVLFVA